MSGFLNVAGIAAPTSFPGFMSLLQTASWRGVPFHVTGAVVRKGRKFAVHEYPFRDGGWVEDMGRAQRVYSFTGYLIGDIAPAMQLALDAAAEAPGPGLLIHPTLGAVNVSLLSCATSVRKEAMRVIEVLFEFREYGQQIFPAALIGAAVSVLASVSSALIGAGSSLGGVAAPAARLGAIGIGAGQSVVTAFAATCLTHASDPTALATLTVGMQSDANTSLGRFNKGNASVSLPAGTTVAGLVAQAAQQRKAVADAGTAAIAAAGVISTSTAQNMVNALDTLIEATRAASTDPADQIQVLLDLAAFNFVSNDVPGSTPGTVGASTVGAIISTLRSAVLSACRRAALISVARASSTYLPHSYEEAASVRDMIADALDAEITIAGDAEEDDTYSTLKALRSAVVADLTARGATLPRVATIETRAPLPSLLLAQILYKDATREEEIVTESRAPHPAFCPRIFEALTA